MSCEICSENFNKSKHKAVTCGSCEYVACRLCVEKYIDNLKVEANCMNCRATWDRNFLKNNMTNVYMTKKYKNHIVNVFCEKEIARIPEAVPIAESMSKIEEYNQQIKDLRLKLRNLKFLVQREFETIENAKKNPQSVTIRGKCPSANCNGFLTENWNCSTCLKKVCEKCTEIETTDHVCNQENMASIELIRAESKPCPSCSARVVKISGCFQMWCTNCNSAFDWTTGRPLRNLEHFHNPHHAEYIQRIRQNPQQQNQLDIFTKIRNSRVSVNFKNYLHSICIRTTDIISRWNNEIVNNSRFENKLLDLRVDHVRNKLSIEDLRKKMARLCVTKNFLLDYGKVLYENSVKINNYIEEGLRDSSFERTHNFESDTEYNIDDLIRVRKSYGRKTKYSHNIITYLNDNKYELR